MSRVLIDTNVILDLLSKREPYYIASQKIFSLADKKMLNLEISSLSLVIVHYVLNDRMKMKDARSVLVRFKVLVDTYELNDKIIELALNDTDFRDFEDGIQYYTALEAQCDLIVTRNLKDFKRSSIPVFSPKEYLAKKRS
ncbi:MAG: PIN domain-containing protein [Saprospiraceae bacterium]|nr:PIN domain-containing protein [Saprospiraceae bacterium]